MSKWERKIPLTENEWFATFYASDDEFDDIDEICSVGDEDYVEEMPTNISDDESHLSSTDEGVNSSIETTEQETAVQLSVSKTNRDLLSKDNFQEILHLGIEPNHLSSSVCLETIEPDLRKNFQILKAAEIRKKVELTPKARKNYNVATRIRRIARAIDIRKGKEVVKERFQRAEKFATSTDFPKANLNKITFDFVCSPLTQQKRKSKGRRFSLDEKIFATSIMKRNAKGYKNVCFTNSQDNKSIFV
ncbi:hypothetical protein QE152_g37202 [Popillia japonica]|uniref:Uncharacterized protein n=1 Tax=Popillia japonica TaxID=7064 RepID=A0AAW1IB97_POPJA